MIIRRRLVVWLCLFVMIGIACVPLRTSAAAPSDISIDFSQTLGSYIHQNGYNNSNINPIPGKSDYAEMNHNGMTLMHAYAYMDSLFPTANHFVPENAHSIDNVAKNSQSFMLNLQFYGTAPNDAAYLDNLKTAIKYFKEKHANLEYIEFWNESGEGLARASQLYKLLTQAVEYVNSTVTNGNKLKVGGFADSNPNRVTALIDYCTANSLPLDFVSWHDYSYKSIPDYSNIRNYLNTKGFTNTEMWITEFNWGYATSVNPPTNTFAALAAANTAAHMFNLTNQNIHGIYYKYKSPWNDAQGQIVYRFEKSSGTSSNLETFDFTNTPARYVQLQVNVSGSNPVTKVSEIEVYDNNNNKLNIGDSYASSDAENKASVYDGNLSTYWSGGKDQDVTLDLGAVQTISYVKIAFADGAARQQQFKIRVSQDLTDWMDVIGSSEALPAGNVYRLWSMLEDTRVPATISSGQETDGKGVGVLATKSDNRAAVLLWNYQNTGTNTYDVNLSISNLPAGFAGKAIKYEQYLIDATHSNYAYDGSSSLSKVMDGVKPLGDDDLMVALGVNAVSLIVLTPDEGNLPGNKISNGNFETGSMSPWVSWNTAGIDSTQPFSGNFGGYVTRSSSLTQTIHGLSPNTTYTYSAYVKLQNGGDSVLMGVNNFGGAELSQTATSTAYQLMSVTFKTGESNTSADVFLYKSGATGTGKAYIDHASVLQHNYAVNGDFETGIKAPWTAWHTAGTDSSSNVFDGVSAGYVTQSSSLTQRITGLSPNTTYTYSAYVKVQHEGDSVNVGVKNYGGMELFQTVTDTSYQLVSITFSTGASNTYADIFLYKSSATAPGKAYMDNVTVQ
ncbi:carbohydrate binding domain-containing protein [Paenibacillus sp. GCM10027626]|uniref:carbohydrate binding domain-containing protein n=1 Tax=Paenibacillus sp. GCM10027626 TaxID=3273411 RepID=UPI0036379702